MKSKINTSAMGKVIVNSGNRGLFTDGLAPFAAGAADG